MLSGQLFAISQSFLISFLYSNFVLDICSPSCIHYKSHECKKTGIGYLCICVFGIFMFAPKNVLTFLKLLAWSYPTLNPKWFGSEFPSKLQLPRMHGKFWHYQFCVDKLGNFMPTDLIIFFLTLCAIKFHQLFGSQLKLFLYA